jgi:hypothetical protein
MLATTRQQETDLAEEVFQTALREYRAAHVGQMALRTEVRWMPEREQIDPGKYFFTTLMNDIENGRVRLPPFQREFVWSVPKVIDLLDSIYKGFPIGSFFYWKADRRYVTLFRDITSLSLPKPAPDQ